MNKKNLIENLNLFRDKAFCRRSHYKASQIWRTVSSNSIWDKNESFKTQYREIRIEWGHVQAGHGFKQACEALDYEIKQAIKLITENEGAE